MTAADQPTAGVALKPLYGSPNYLQDPDGLARIRESLIQTPDWHDPAPINCNSLARLLDTIEALRTPASGAVEADIDRLCTALLDGVGCTPWGHSSWDNDGTDGASRESVRQSVRRVLAALTSEPKAEGAKTLSYDQKGKRLYEAFWSRNGGDAPTWDEQARAIRTMWKNIARDAADLFPAPQPLQGGEVTGEAQEAINWMVLEAANLERSGARTYPGNGVDAALANAMSKQERERAAKYRAILALISPAQREGEG